MRFHCESPRHFFLRPKTGGEDIFISYPRQELDFHQWGWIASLAKILVQKLFRLSSSLQTSSLLSFLICGEKNDHIDFLGLLEPEAILISFFLTSECFLFDLDLTMVYFLSCQHATVDWIQFRKYLYLYCAISGICFVEHVYIISLMKRYNLNHS